VLSGRWWNTGNPETQIALTEDLASVFGVKPGTRMDFQAGNRQISGRVSALIRIAPAQRAWWREIILNCKELPNARYSGAITVVPGRLEEARRFLRDRFPDLLILYIDELLTRTERVGAEMLRAIALVGGAAALMAAFVLLALIRSMRVFRVQEIALLRALGARRATLLGAVAAEYFALGALGGLFGAILGFGAISLLLHFGAGLSGWVFDLSAVPIAMLTSAGFASLVATLGWWPLMLPKPLELLRWR
jgi:putative ABC transport system permease protein